MFGIFQIPSLSDQEKVALSTEFPGLHICTDIEKTQTATFLYSKVTEIILISHSHFIPLVFAECIHRKAPASPSHNKEHKKKVCDNFNQHITLTILTLQSPYFGEGMQALLLTAAETPPNSSRDPKSALNNLTQCLVFKLLVTLSSHSLRNSDVPCLITRGLQF